LFELSAENAVSYLRSRRLNFRNGRVSELGGGVSNTVLLIESGGQRLVLKQALGKLRVEQDWFSDRERIFRESSAIRALAAYLPPCATPRVLFEDRDNWLFAMTAAPPEAQSWKSQLLAGTIRAETAEKVARMLAAMVRRSWREPEWERSYGDQTVFDQLRLDPYYRSTAQRHPDLLPHFERLLADSRARRVSLVHGDWSPKNFLVSGSSVMVIDFEVIHFGDPAFDCAFLLNHLLLKSFYRPQWREGLAELAARFWHTYREALPAEAEWIEPATIQHLGCLLLARVDGKSPAEYLNQEALRDQVRQFARALIQDPPATIADVFRRV
jgi:5-methylthioribose kinase